MTVMAYAAGPARTRGAGFFLNLEGLAAGGWDGG